MSFEELYRPVTALAMRNPGCMPTTLTFVSAEPIYYVCRNAYNMVLHKFGNKLYEGLNDALRKHLGDVVRPEALVAASLARF